ncbi:MAG: amidohydrolase family protein [Bryobacteraceae bacterium]|nr:amidohydrolase family protein [Bryobacteraceae bacterium]
MAGKNDKRFRIEHAQVIRLPDFALFGQCDVIASIFGFYAAFTRQYHAGNPPGGFLPDQVLSRARALESFTLDGAYASFKESKKGTITVGKLADFLILDRDIMTVAPKEVIATKIKLTVLNGEVVHRQ